MPPGKLNPTKRFAVRMSLVTGSTLAVMMGAQSLAMLDKKMFSSPDIAVPAVSDPVGGAVVPAASPTWPAPTAAQAAPTTVPAAVVHAAPSIMIIRQPGQTGAVVGAPSTTTVIKPPEPVQLAAPDPVVVQAPAQQIIVQSAAPAPAAPPVTRSSR